MSYTEIILFSAALVNLTLALLVIIKNRKNKINVLFSVVLLGLIFWCIGIAFYRTATPATINFWGQFVYFAINFAIVSLLYFSFVFPKGDFPKNFFIRLLLILPPIAIFVISLIPYSIIKENVILENNIYIEVGWGYYVHSVVTALYFVWAFVNLILKYRKSLGIERSQLLYLFLGTAISTIIGFTTNVVLFFVTTQYNWIGPSGTIIMAGFIAYAIFSYRLLDIRLVAIEIFSVFLVVVSFLQIFEFLGVSYLMRIASFILTLSVSILLVRSAISEVKRSEEKEQLNKALESANAKLKVLDKAKSDFIDMASHQLRTPLTAVRGWTSMLIQGDFGPLNEKQMNALKIVFMASDQQNNLVEDLLNAARIEAGRIEYSFEEVDLDQLVDEVVKQLEPLALSKKLPLSYIKPKKKLPLVKIDRVKIRQIVINFTENAIKYTSSGFVQVNLEQVDNKLRFSVTDTGMGITKADFKNLFQKFGRGSNNQARAKGTGVGLYTAKIMLGAHPGGRIWAESEGEGKGSKFCFEVSV